MYLGAKKSLNTVIIIGWYVGLGALIQSTVNSIWLSRKLGKKPVVWWGKSCLYTDKTQEGNTYARLFQAPSDNNLDNLDFYRPNLLVYPNEWQSINGVSTVEEIDLLAPDISLCHSLEINSHQKFIDSDLCIIYQYFSSDLAIELANLSGLKINKEDFLNECNDIFTQYFQPKTFIKDLAQNIWNDMSKSHKSHIIAMHLRGTDKFIEKAVPSPRRYIHTLKKLKYLTNDISFFIATDSESYLQVMQNHLRKYFVAFQNMSRSRDSSALHYHYQHPSDGFNNGVAMIIDIELLTKCETILAYPGSQIFWWLTRKQESENLTFTLIPVNPDCFNWIYAVWMVIRLMGFNAFLNFLRAQKSNLLSYIKSRQDTSK